MVTKHKYVKAIPLSVAYDKLANEIATAKRKAFADAADAVPPDMPVCFIWRKINRVVPGVIEGSKLREIGAEMYVSAQPFTKAQIAAILANADETAVELREGGS